MDNYNTYSLFVIHITTLSFIDKYLYPGFFTWKELRNSLYLHLIYDMKSFKQLL